LRAYETIKNEHFWLTDDEKELYKLNYEQLNTTLKIFDIIKGSAKRGNVSINKDGQYSCRSSLGKKLRKQKSDNILKHNEIKSNIYKLERIPVNQWNMWKEKWQNKFNKFNEVSSKVRRAKSMIKNTKYPLIVWFFFSILMFKDSSFFLMASMMSAIIFLSFYIYSSLNKSNKNEMNFYSLNISQDKPPIVTIQNIDNHTLKSINENVS
jgi:hypothetical protein